jgi:pyrroline-5-carboxylate reductase
MFDCVGKTVLVDESYMDALGAVSGCGPAYMYQIIEALADGAVLAGLPRAMAYELAAQTMAGSAMMVLETGMHPGVLKDQVTSPGGTTIRGIQAMESHGVRNAMIEAVQQAYIRSKELGET